MQWDGSENAGFSSAAPDRLYLPVDQNGPTVDAQECSQGSLLQFVRRLIILRKTMPALHPRASLEVLHTSPTAAAYFRKRGRQTLLIILNPSDKEAVIHLPYSRSLKCIEGFGKVDISEKTQSSSIKAGPVSFYILSGL